MAKKFKDMFAAPKSNVQFSEGQKSKGILDDFAVRTAVDTTEGTIQNTPTNAKDIVNKEYHDNNPPKLNEVENPDASKVFNLGNNKTLSFTSVDHTPVADYGIFNIEAKGAFSGSLLHVHQHTGNPGATELLTLEAEDADVLPLKITGVHATGIDMGTSKIVALVDPTADQEAATKKYVDDEDAAADAHITADGTSHSHVVTNDTHVAGDGSDHADVATNTAASHAESHTIASHNDTTGTGTELDTLTDNSMADALHRHSELSASDGTPDQAVFVDVNGNVTIDNTLGIGKAPAVTLDVNGNATINGNIIVTGTVDGIDIATDVAANTLKDTNVTTNLSLGAGNATTEVVACSDGTDCTLIEADTDNAGLLGADKPPLSSS